MRKPIKELFGKRETLSIEQSKTMIEAFQMISQKLVSGLAVVDDHGQLVGNISASDMRVIKNKNINFRSFPMA